MTAHHRRATRRAHRVRAVAALCAVVALTLSGLPSSDSAFAGPTDLVVFADPGLQAAVNAVLGDSPGATVTEAEADTVISLDASNSNISDLGGIEHFTNLTVLGLYSNEVVDVSPLAGLTDLTTLDLGSNEVADVSPLAGLTDLTWLDLYRNEVVDVSPLAALTNLYKLYLGDNDIVDVSPLAALTNLYKLYLGGNEIVDVSPLVGLTNLFSLDLVGQSVSVALASVGDVTANPVVDEAGNPVAVWSGDPGFSYNSGTDTWSFTTTGTKILIWSTEVTIGSNAATFSGQITQSVGPTGLLRATTSPALPSRITVDGHVADTWGLEWVALFPGSHEVCFSDVAGYGTPPCETVDVMGGQTTTVDGAFTQRGYLHVTTSPPVPSQILIDGHPADNWGLWTDVAVGTHQVCFGMVENFDPPTCQNVNVTAGATADVTGTFMPNPFGSSQSGVGMLRVTTSPALPSRITVDGHAGDNWGLEWLELAPGSHEVCFGDVAGYGTPACDTVAVSAGATTTLTGAFTQLGTLKVTTSPPVAGTIYVDGIPRDAWGVWSEFNVGSHEVCFGDVAGSVTPSCQTAVVTAGNTTQVTGTYT